MTRRILTLVTEATTRIKIALKINHRNHRRWMIILKRISPGEPSTTNEVGNRGRNHRIEEFTLGKQRKRMSETSSRDEKGKLIFSDVKNHRKEAKNTSKCASNPSPQRLLVNFQDYNELTSKNEEKRNLREKSQIPQSYLYKTKPSTRKTREKSKFGRKSLTTLRYSSKSLTTLRSSSSSSLSLPSSSLPSSSSFSSSSSSPSWTCTWSRLSGSPPHASCRWSLNRQNHRNSVLRGSSERSTSTSVPSVPKSTEESLLIYSKIKIEIILTEFKSAYVFYVFYICDIIIPNPNRSYQIITYSLHAYLNRLYTVIIFEDLSVASIAKAPSSLRHPSIITSKLCLLSTYFTLSHSSLSFSTMESRLCLDTHRIPEKGITDRNLLRNQSVLKIKCLKINETIEMFEKFIV